MTKYQNYASIGGFFSYGDRRFKLFPTRNNTVRPSSLINRVRATINPADGRDFGFHNFSLTNHWETGDQYLPYRLPFVNRYFKYSRFTRMFAGPPGNPFNGRCQSNNKTMLEYDCFSSASAVSS